ncbi:MAG: hypothetical protein WCK03_02290, partial [Candidatus Taylorbacteria bacterium]
FGDIQVLFESSGELGFINNMQSIDTERLLWKKTPDREVAKKHLIETKLLLDKLDKTSFNTETVRSAIWPYVEKNGKGDVLWPLRMSVTGQDRSPDPFVCISILGKDESLKRISVAISLLEKTS